MRTNQAVHRLIRPVVLVAAVAAGVRAVPAEATASRPDVIRFRQLAAATSGRPEVTSLTGRFGFSTHTGALLVMAIANGTSCSNPIATVTDSGGNTWQRASSVCLSDAFPNLEVWFVPNAAPARTVTASWTQQAHAMMDLYEFTGAAASPLDGASTAGGHGDLFGTSSPATPSAPGELAVGALCGDVIQPITVTTAAFHNAPQLAAGSALTLRSGAASLTSVAPISYDGTWSAPMDWVGLIALFKAA